MDGAGHHSGMSAYPAKRRASPLVCFKAFFCLSSALGWVDLLSVAPC